MSDTKATQTVEPKFTAGQRIEWMSSYTNRAGEILGIVAPEESIAARLRGMFGFTIPKSRIKVGDTAANARYLVKVDPPAVKRRGARSMRQPDSVFYAPLVKVIDGDSSAAGKLVKR